MKTIKNETFTISLEDAKILALHSQGLLNNGTKSNTLDLVEKLGYIQIDTLAVIARAHHHTLWTRNEAYKEEELKQLVEQDKSVFEYWSHAASYLPMKDYRFSLLKKKAYAEGKSHWFEQDKNLKSYVLDRIKAEGGLQSKDFEHKNKKATGWYDWKPAKKALEQLFMEGELMVAQRKGFQKVYDLTERVLPANLDTTIPTLAEYCQHLINSAIQAHGLIHESEISYLRNKIKEPLNKEIKKLLKEEKIITIKVEGFDKLEFLTTENKLKELEKIKLRDSIHFLSPFDNSIIQRKRVERFFSFDYIIECYVPEEKRKYGYFTLPILFNNKFVGRFDPKADRANKTFYIKKLHFEDNFKPNEKFIEMFKSKLKTFALFNKCENWFILDENWKNK